MAINYLNNITLNKNQLLQTAIENQINDSAVGASPVEGQIYFNTTDDVLKVYGGGTWSEVGGGVITLTLNDGTYIDVNSTGDAANPIFAPDLNAVDGTAVAATRFLSKDNTWDVPAFDNYSGWTLDGDSGTGEVISSGNTATFAGGLKITTDVASTDTLNIVHDLQSQTNSTSAASPAAGATFTVIDSVTIDTTGHVGGKNLKTITLPADTNTQETYTLPVSAGTAVTGYTVADIDLTAAGTSTGIKSKVTFAGKNSNIAITETTGNNGIVKIALTTDVVIDDNLTVGGEINQTSTGNDNVFASELNMSSQKITNVLDPASPQDAATKQYVDDATLGGLIYQGAYNASTNTPDLDSASSIAVKKGWTYTVTVAGLFFTEQVRVGDVLIAEVDQAVGASALANWTTVQNNIDLASLTEVGIGNVVPGGAIDVSYSSGTATVSVEDSTASNKGAVIVDGSDPITVTYNSGTATVGIEDSAAAQKGAVIVSGGTGISVAYASGTATVTNTDTNATNTNALGTIAIGALSGTTTHNFGTKNTIVQTIDQNGDTVFCDITRTTNTCVATIATAQTAATGGIITILVQKIG